MRIKILAVLITIGLLEIAGAGVSETLQNGVSVGDTVTFGRYEQDNDLTNGKEPIEWRVLKVEEDTVLLISRKALDAQPYNQRGGCASWVKSSIRKWLNEEFYNEAFDDTEKESIVTKDLENRKEANTADPVFLLSTWDAKELFSSHPDRQVSPTAYAVGQGVYQSEKFGPGNVHWWLRTTSWESWRRAAYVATSGGVMTCGGEVDGNTNNPKMAVRPAIYVKVDAVARITDP